MQELFDPCQLRDRAGPTLMGDDITEQEFIDGIDGHEPRMQRQQAQAVS